MPTDTHVLQVTVFTPREGQFDEFVRRQLEGLPKFGDIPGSRGSQFYRSQDNRTAILLSRWDSADDVQRFSQTEPSAAHRATLLPLLETASSGAYELVYQRTPETAV